MVDLKKDIKPDSLRGKGLLPSGIAPGNLPIAGRSRESILAAMRCEAFAIGRISPENAFVVRHSESVYYLFLRPEYKGYRRVAALRFGGIPPEHDIDHVHARNLAAHYGYRYVLVVLLPESINRLHGIYEQHLKDIKPTDKIPDVCFADVRIFDKLLGRDPKVRRLLGSKEYAYDTKDRVDLTLALNQSGRWNIAFGFDRPAPAEFLSRLRPLRNFES
ncbi:MAG TPA: hypothetical protein VKB46_00595 [Pyrinomonadaceae bacterium]|nr:hypothetical protein [Pyrinomonadaceae bacterium]